MSKPIIQLNEESVKSELKELVRNSVEETLNELLNKEAEELTSAAKYERTEARQGYRSGHYSRKLTTTSLYFQAHKSDRYFDNQQALMLNWYHAYYPREYQQIMADYKV